MATFYERLQIYNSRPDAVAFSKTKMRRLAHWLKKNFDEHRPGHVHKYVQSHENGLTFWVRDYPEAYIRTIDGLLMKLHAAAQPPPPPKIRKRIPAARKPVYSTKK